MSRRARLRGNQPVLGDRGDLDESRRRYLRQLVAADALRFQLLQYGLGLRG